MVQVPLEASVNHATKAGNLVSTPRFSGMYWSMPRPLITPDARSPLETPSVPSSIMRVPATQMRWMNNSPFISSFRKRKTSSNRSLFFEVPLK